MVTAGSSSTALMADKVKFTVSVRGHQWSSARHLHETLQEFAKVIERNARRLDFIGEGDTVERLQLARSDGTDPEELDVDATLEDVIICMGNKHLVAIISDSDGSSKLISTKAAAEWHEIGEIKADQTKPASDLSHLESSVCKNETPGGVFSLATPTSAPSCRQELISSMPNDANCVAAAPTTASLLVQGQASLNKCMYSLPARGLRITIPSDQIMPDHDQSRDSACSRIDCRYDDGRSNFRQIPGLATRATGSLMSNGSCYAGNLPCFYLNSNAMACSRMLAGSSATTSTPSPAELAQILVEGSSNPQQHHSGSSNEGKTNSNLSTNPASRLFSASQSGFGLLNHALQSFQSLAPPCLSSKATTSTQMIGSSNLKFSGASTPSIAVLAQFLASQLRAFVPTDNHQTTTAADEQFQTCTGKWDSGISPPQLQKVPHHLQESERTSVNGITVNSGEHRATSLVTDQHQPIDKDQSSSSAVNVHQDAASLNINGAENDNAKLRTELVFLVNRRSKTGKGTHRLRMSDLSSYFHLSVVDAAKKLGVSQTTLKKACRKFGLKRWPGRKVRSLESTIHGLEHTIAIGQGTGMEELTEAQIRSEVLKLQQEMDQLVHGLPTVPQCPTGMRTTDVYKRLYSRGWRSKQQSACNLQMGGSEALKLGKEDIANEELFDGGGQKRCNEGVCELMKHNTQDTSKELKRTRDAKEELSEHHNSDELPHIFQDIVKVHPHSYDPLYPHLHAFSYFRPHKHFKPHLHPPSSLGNVLN